MGERQYYFFNAASEAITGIEASREGAATRQRESGRSDAGLRGQVTSGGHLDPLANVIANVLVDAGLNRDSIYIKQKLELPGYFRPEKKWDLLAFHDGELVAAIELKSIWSSYGNNMNNRAEEAIGSGYDFRLANKNELFGKSVPWLGYVFVIKDDPAIHAPKSSRNPHFAVDPAFDGASYLDRSILTCRRLVAERVYDRAFYAVCDASSRTMSEPASDMTWSKFEAALRGKVAEALA